MKFYVDGNRQYLELHALRAPVGNYKTMSESRYETKLFEAIADFDVEHDTQTYELGRSGRHICIEDTPENRARYDELSAAAIHAAYDFWNSVRTVKVHA